MSPVTESAGDGVIGFVDAQWSIVGIVTASSSG